jgi:hypothetical protein
MPQSWILNGSEISEAVTSILSAASSSAKRRGIEDLINAALRYAWEHGYSLTADVGDNEIEEISINGAFISVKDASSK